MHGKLRIWVHQSKYIIKREKRHVINSMTCLLHYISLSLVISPTTSIFHYPSYDCLVKTQIYLHWHYLSNMWEFGWAILSNSWLCFFQAFASSEFFSDLKFRKILVTLGCRKSITELGFNEPSLRRKSWQQYDNDK